MSETTCTFNKMLTDGEIVIPIIQRDYVQGSDKQEERRNEFVESLISTLASENKSQNLDFIYGRTNETNEFLPLDGQQRLTTLFLLTWFLYKKVGKYSEIRDQLKKFSYKTRISTTSFCEMLVEFETSLENVDGENKIQLSSVIRDNIHYNSTWDSDPTIQSMLDLLDYLQYRFEKENTQENEFTITDEVLNHMYERLRDGAICFDLLDMNNDGFKMTDELYIKMNARGKQLTEFENFKAWFINKLETDCFKELKEEFCEKIEYDWTQLFWPYAIKKWEALTEEEQAEEKYPTIDAMLQNFVEVISELLFFKDNLNEDSEKFTGTKKQYSSVYFRKQSKKEDDKEIEYVDESNIKFLFTALDFFFNLSREGNDNNPEKINIFFDNFFTINAHLPDESEKVRLFGIKSDDKFGTNLFAECFNLGLEMDVNKKILLFCLLYANQNHNIKENMNYIRVIRNLLETVRQKNDTSYNTNIRINHFGSYWKLLSQLSKGSDVYSILINGDYDRTDSKFTELALKHETEKAVLCQKPEIKISIFSLEDNEELRGSLQNLKITQNSNNLNNYAKIFYNLFNSDIEDSLITRTLIAFGYQGLYIKECKLGETYFFGNRPNWDVIFTFGYDDSDPNYNVIAEMLNGITEKFNDTFRETLQKLIDTSITNYSNDDWQYYFLKYKEFYSLVNDTKNYYAWLGNFEIRKIRTIQSPLIAKHINPYVLTVAKKLGEGKCSLEKCMKQYDENSPLVLNNGVSLTCKNEGWFVVDENEVISTEIKSKYSIGNDMILRHNKQKDRVEIAESFCNEILKIDS